MRPNPIEGHGMNAGIQDAYNLGWKLAHMVSGTATGPLIESYEAERQAIDRDIVRSGDMAYGRMVPAADEAREDLIDFLNSPKGPEMAATASSEIAATYHKSPIVADVGMPAPLPPLCTVVGCRIGDVDGLVTTAGSVGFHDLIQGVAPSVFVTAGDGDPEALVEWSGFLASAVDLHPSLFETAYVVCRNIEGASLHGGLLGDPSGSLHDRLGGAPLLCVVRPDGHLGFRCAPPSLDALQDHLDLLIADSK